MFVYSGQEMVARFKHELHALDAALAFQTYTGSCCPTPRLVLPTRMTAQVLDCSGIMLFARMLFHAMRPRCSSLRSVPVSDQ